jgi:hypothetical protein
MTHRFQAARTIGGADVRDAEPTMVNPPATTRRRAHCRDDYKPRTAAQMAP